MRLPILLIALLFSSVASGEAPSSPRSRAAVERVTPRLSEELAAVGLRLGAPVFLRIIKDEALLEAWLEGVDGRFVLARTWPICAFSGGPGPKTREGDLQAPEGFYFVPPSRMNPASQFHLSFDLGYPNAFDRAHGGTGAYLMVHGACVSIGCYAMTDPVIEELWTLMDAAFANGQPFIRVHAVPFRPTPEALASRADSPHADLWGQLAVGWAAFEDTGAPPNIEVRQGRYVVERRAP